MIKIVLKEDLVHYELRRARSLWMNNHNLPGADAGTVVTHLYYYP